MHYRVGYCARPTSTRRASELEPEPVISSGFFMLIRSSATPADFKADSWKPVFAEGAKWVVGPPAARKPAKGDKAAPAASGLELRLGAQQVVIVEQALSKP